LVGEKGETHLEREKKVCLRIRGDIEPHEGVPSRKPFLQKGLDWTRRARYGKDLKGIRQARRRKREVLLLKVEPDAH